MPGNYCCVVGCGNGYYRLKRWRSTQCQQHPESLHRDCPCLEPFQLYVFPAESPLRDRWIAAIGLERKGWTPKERSVVCSVHFKDGKPTETSPDPTEKLGVRSKVLINGCLVPLHKVKKRRPTGFNVFASENHEGIRGKMQILHAKWRSLTDDEKNQYRERARSMQSPRVAILEGLEELNRRRDELTKMLGTVLDDLQKLGVESVAVLFDREHNQTSTFGSESSVFSLKPDLLAQLEQWFRVGAPASKKIKLSPSTPPLSSPSIPTLSIITNNSMSPSMSYHHQQQDLQNNHLVTIAASPSMTFHALPPVSTIQQLQNKHLTPSPSPLPPPSSDGMVLSPMSAAAAHLTGHNDISSSSSDTMGSGVLPPILTSPLQSTTTTSIQMSPGGTTPLLVTTTTSPDGETSSSAQPISVQVQSSNGEGGEIVVIQPLSQAATPCSTPLVLSSATVSTTTNSPIALPTTPNSKPNTTVIKRNMTGNSAIDNLTADQKKEERTKLRLQLRELYNKKYAEAIGENKKFPYKDYSLGKVRITPLNWPEAVPFKVPNNYSLKDLKAIADSREHIMFMVERVSNELVTTTQPHVHASPNEFIPDTTGDTASNPPDTSQPTLDLPQVPPGQVWVTVSGSDGQPPQYMAVTSIKQEHLTNPSSYWSNGYNGSAGTLEGSPPTSIGLDDEPVSADQIKDPVASAAAAAGIPTELSASNWPFTVVMTNQTTNGGNITGLECPDTPNSSSNGVTTSTTTASWFEPVPSTDGPGLQVVKEEPQAWFVSNPVADSSASNEDGLYGLHTM